MTQPFLDIALIVARLQQQVPALRAVAEAMSLPAASEDLKHQAPAAWVLPLSTQVGANVLANAVSQQATETLGVLIAVRSLRDITGEKSRAELTPLRAAVGTALLNWQPGAEYTPCEYAGGRLMQLTDRVLWWLDQYRTTFVLRNT